MRQYDCASYDRCMDRAARHHSRVQFCERCTKYMRAPLAEVRLGSEYICHGGVNGECPHDTEHPLVCAVCGGSFLRLKTDPPPDPAWVCSMCQDRAAMDQGIAACHGDKLAESRYWLTCAHHDWSFQCGDPIHNIDIGGLIGDLERLRESLRALLATIMDPGGGGYTLEACQETESERPGGEPHHSILRAIKALDGEDGQ